MKSNRNIRAVTVGIFVTIGLAIFIVAVLALGGQRKTFAKTISIKALFDDVNGLQSGSNIWYAGVKVGTVKKISFDPDARVAVLMDIEEKSKKYIHKNAKAKIGTDGLIGNKIVVIYGGTPQVPEVVEGDLINVDKAVGMDEMLSALQANNKNLLDITTDFKTITHKIVNGEGTIGRLVNDDALANDLQATLRTLRTASVNAQKFSSDLAAYSSKLTTRGSLTNDLVTDTVIFARLRAAVIQIQKLSETASAVVANLNSATAGINKSLSDTSTPAGVLLHDRQTASYLKGTVRNLQSGSEKLNDDLEALQHNFLFRGFFKKKAKTTTK